MNRGRAIGIVPRMARSRTVRTLVTRVSPDDVRRRPDELIVEEPMTIQLDGTVVSTTMRTPGNDFELAAGWCFTEGLLAGAPVTAVRYCADGSAVESAFNVVTVETSGRAPAPVPRLAPTSSSCGWCGSEQLDTLASRLTPVDGAAAFTPALLASIPAAVAEQQGLFEATGAVHAAALFTAAGDIVVVREDVGRHNAVDKVIGNQLLAGALPTGTRSTGRLPARANAGDSAAGDSTPGDHASVDHGAGEPRGLYVSGRASIEIVQKAWAAGCAAIVAVSAPTALAVDAARRAGILLVGFLRGDSYNVYAPERLG